MSKKILFVMPLVLALALVAFVSTSAQGKVALTDAQMSSIHGGNVYETGPTACAGLEVSGDCSGSDDPNVPNPWPGGSGGCAGTWMTSCKQSEKYCLQEGWQHCFDDPDIDCEGTYDTGSCGMKLGECETEPGDSFDCSGRNPGQKSDAHPRT